MSHNSCHSTILVSPWEAQACLLWDVTSFHTERFFSSPWEVGIPGHCFEYLYWHLIIQLCFHGVIAFVRSLASPCSDLHRPSSFSLGYVSISGVLSSQLPPGRNDLSLGGCRREESVRLILALGERQVVGRQWEEVPQDSDYPEKSGVCSIVCVPSIYFKLLLTYLSGDRYTRIPDSSLPMLHAVDGTGQINHSSVVTGISGLMHWSNQAQINLSLWQHNTLTWWFLIWTSGIYKSPEIVGSIVYTCKYAHCSGERVHTFHLILIRFCSLTMLKLYTQGVTLTRNFLALWPKNSRRDERQTGPFTVS